MWLHHDYADRCRSRSNWAKCGIDTGVSFLCNFTIIRTFCNEQLTKIYYFVTIRCRTNKKEEEKKRRKKIERWQWKKRKKRKENKISWKIFFTRLSIRRGHIHIHIFIYICVKVRVKSLRSSLGSRVPWRASSSDLSELV